MDKILVALLDIVSGEANTTRTVYALCILSTTPANPDCHIAGLSVDSGCQKRVHSWQRNS